MAAVSDKEFMRWYLTTLKLKEIAETILPISQPATPFNSSTPLLPAQGQPTPLQNPQPDSEWVISMEEKLNQVQQSERSNPSSFSIYRVPKSLRKIDINTYTPQFVSIGPYHRPHSHLHDMEYHKWRALNQVIRRTGHSISLYLDVVKSLEDKARCCYEGPINLSSGEFVEMMVLDGIFVLEIFRGTVGEGFRSLGYSSNDSIFAMRGIMHSIRCDMIKLENQIPLFILNRLLALQPDLPQNDSNSVAHLAIKFFEPFMPTDEPLRESESTVTTFDPLSEDGLLHCLDIFRRSLLRAKSQPTSRVWNKRWPYRKPICDKRRQQLVHCVTKLHKAVVEFEKRTTDRLWDIKFKNGVLHVLRLFIHTDSKSLFLNLIAFEQCHLGCSNDLTSYAVFMDSLINSEEDVSRLRYCGIIEHGLGTDNEVAHLFNELSQEVAFDINYSYLSELSKKVKSYYDNRCNTYKANFKHKYCSNPWVITSLVAATVLLVFTFSQTFYTVYGYYYPRS